MQIHELNNFTGTLGSGSFLAVDNGTDTGKLSTQQLLAGTEARIDNIIAGPAPSAEEIVDARLGADGVTYPSLGDAIRDQFTDVKSDLSDEETARANADNTLSASITSLGIHKVAQPLDEFNQPTNGTDGQSLRTKGDGTTEWADIGLPTDEQTAQAVSAWLDDHPEATTTVQDASLTEAKFSDALKLKAIKDYVTPEMFGAKGDGETDDTEAIQSALDYLSTSNVKTIIFSKKYVITHLHVYSDTVLLGTGGELFVKDDYCTDSSMSYYVIENVGEDNVTYQNLIMHGNSENNTAFLVCDLITCMGKKSRVIGCLLNDCIDSGIMFSQVEDGLCCENIINGATDLGIYVNDSSSGISKGSIISNNIISNCVNGGIGVKRATKNITVSQNSIRDCGNGITMEQVAGNDFSSENSITNNYVKNVTDYGINIRGGSKYVISGNTLIDCGSHGILIQACENSVIASNYISMKDAAVSYDYNGAIRLTNYNSLYTCRNLVITDNVINTFQLVRCFSIGYDSSFIMSDIIISNNIFDDNNTTAAFLRLFSTPTIENCVITNNVSRYETSIMLDGENHQSLYISNMQNIRLRNTRTVPCFVAMQMFDSGAKNDIGIRLINPIRSNSDMLNATYKRGDIVPTCATSGVLFYYATADGVGSSVLAPLISK